MTTYLRKNFFTTSVIIALLGAFFLSLAFATPASAGVASGSMTGYAWSDTIGWISVNGPGYGLVIAADGTVSGYAWSDNIGWISARAADLAGCPTAPCTAQWTGTALKGWFKALAADTRESGGWDGWISLSGSQYGPTITGSNVSGFAWGSMVVGWVDMSLVQIAVDCPVGETRDASGQCVPTVVCPSGSTDPDCSKVCPAGTQIMTNGECLPNDPGCVPGSTLPQCVPQCPVGETRDANGQCVPTVVCPSGSADPDCSKVCPAGTQVMTDGECLPTGCTPGDTAPACQPSCAVGETRDANGQCVPTVVCPVGSTDPDCSKVCPAGTQIMTNGECLPTGCTPGDTAPACQPSCAVGETRDAGGQCVPTTFACTGATPTNATLCTGDSTGLTQDTPLTVVASCGASKCEYTCASGYVKQGNSCVPDSGSCPLLPFCDASTNTQFNVQGTTASCTYVPSGSCSSTCTRTPYCDVTTNTQYNVSGNTTSCTLVAGGYCTSVCPAGFSYINGSCVYTACPSGFTLQNGVCVPACVPSNVCNASNDLVNSCTGALVQSCTNGCSAGGCIGTAAPTITSWSVTPTLVRVGTVVNVSWVASNVQSCTVRGTNGDGSGSNATGLWNTPTGTKTSTAISSQTIFTITCTGLAGSNPASVTKSSTVNILPAYNEK